MTLYRDMTTPQLAQHGLHWKTTSPHEHRMIYALAKRLEQEYQRPPNPAFIKVAKPHIQRVLTEPRGRGMWRCAGPFGTVQYGPGPGEAYAAWRRAVERSAITSRSSRRR